MKRDTFYAIQTIRFLLVMVLVTNTVMSVFMWAVVPSSSMEPALKIGTFCITRRTEDVHYGGIVCFLPYDEAPAHNGVLYSLALKFKKKQVYVKRVIGLSGDKIEIRNGRLYRNDEQIEESYLKERNIDRDFAPVTVEDRCVFFMGNNRNNSKDSRSFGQIPYALIIGRVFWYIAPFNFSDQ